MGRFARTVLCLIPAFSALFPFRLGADDAGGSGMHATVKDYILPQYRSGDRHLQFVIFGDEATNKGSLVSLNNTMIDILHSEIGTLEEADIFLPGRGQRIPPPYPLDASKETIRAFWSHPKQHAVRAWIFTDKSVYDKTTNALRSDSRAAFRSREMDVDGIGFDAYHEKKFIHIRSNVRVIIRSEVRRGLLKESQENDKKQEK